MDAGEVVSVCAALVSALSAGASALAQPDRSPNTRERVSARVTVFFIVDLLFEGVCPSFPIFREKTRNDSMIPEMHPPRKI